MRPVASSQPEPASAPTSPGPARGRLAQLVGLSAFAVGQPLLWLSTSHPGFLVAHRVTPGDVLMLVAAAFLALPLALFAVEQSLGLVSDRLAGLLHGGFVAGLCTLLALPVANQLLPETTTWTIALAALPGLALAWLAARLGWLRGALEILAFAPLLFAAAFVADPDVRALLRQDRAPLVESPHLDRPAPVVMVIFDELPLTSLLDESGDVDASQYPAFAALADHATWFENATTVSSYTQQAVPAILTGRYPGTEPRLAVASEQPHNLFSLLAASHELNAVESQMQLGDPAVLPRPPFRSRWRVLAGDLSVLGLHTILPDSLSSRLPDVTATLSGFGLGGPDEAGASGAPAHINHPARFQAFVESIEASERPALHFIHSPLPHRPWQYLPSGSAYFPYRIHGTRPRFETAPGAWWQQEAYQRHLLQVAYVDRLLGQLLDRLQQRRLYDDALVVVTADHGVGFWPEDNSRILGATAHPEDILGVPLFIKRPGQRGGERRLENVETVDVLPTIAGLLGARWPMEDADSSGWRFDGCDLFDASCPGRPEKIAYSSSEPRPKRMQELRFPADLGLRKASLRRKQAQFGDGLYRFGPYRGLVGRRVSDFAVTAGAAGSVSLDRGPRPGYHDPAERLVPARTSGRLELFAEGVAAPHVAVASSGAIQTVVPAEADEEGVRWVLAMVPEDSLVEDEPPILFLVAGPPERPTLRPLEIR